MNDYIINEYFWFIDVAIIERYKYLCNFVIIWLQVKQIEMNQFIMTYYLFRIYNKKKQHSTLQLMFTCNLMKPVRTIYICNEVTYIYISFIWRSMYPCPFRMRSEKAHIKTECFVVLSQLSKKLDLHSRKSYPVRRWKLASIIIIYEEFSRFVEYVKTGDALIYFLILSSII